MSETVATRHYTGVKSIEPTSTAGPIGLFAFGIATVPLSLVYAGLYPLDSMIVMMGVYVGFAMVITGYMEWRKGNSFGAAAFFTFGFFWLSFVGLLLLPALKVADAPSPTAMAAYLFMWALFAFVTFIATLKYNRALQFIFAIVAILFALLGLGYLTGNPLFTTVAGYVGVIGFRRGVYRVRPGAERGVREDGCSVRVSSGRIEDSRCSPYEVVPHE